MIFKNSTVSIVFFFNSLCLFVCVSVTMLLVVVLGKKFIRAPCEL